MSPLLYQLSYTATYEACTKCRSPRQGVYNATNKDSPAWRIPCLCAGYPLPGCVGYPLPVLVQRVLVMSQRAGRVTSILVHACSPAQGEEQHENSRKHMP